MRVKSVNVLCVQSDGQLCSGSEVLRQRPLHRLSQLAFGTYDSSFPNVPDSNRVRLSVCRFLSFSLVVPRHCCLSRLQFMCLRGYLDTYSC